MNTIYNEGIAIGVGELCNVNLRPIAFDAHCYYVSKTLTGKQVDDIRDRQLDGLFLPDSVIDRSNWCEVVAIGKNVGKPCTREHMKKFQRAKYLDKQVDVGDLVLIEDMAPFGLIRSPVANFEFFVEEGLPKAILKR